MSFSTNSQPSDVLIVTARDVGTWVREKLSPSRMFSEWMMSDYKDKMETLRQVDERIYAWTKNLDKMVDEMRKALAAGRYVDLFTLLAELNKKLLLIEAIGGNVKQLQDEALREFETRRELDLPNILEPQEKLPAGEGADLAMVKDAGVKDWARKMVIEKFLDKERKERRRALLSLINKAARTVGRVQELVGKLGKARATGEIGTYLTILGRISKEQKNFYADFRPVYDKHLKPLVDRVLAEERAKRQEDKVPNTQPMEETLKNEEADQEAKILQRGVPKTVPGEPLPDLPELEMESPKEPGMWPESEAPPESEIRPTGIRNTVPGMNLPVSDEEENEDVINTQVKSPPTQRSPRWNELDDGLKKAFVQMRNSEFMTKLAAIEDKNQVVQLVLAYAEEMEEFDSETATDLTLMVSEMLTNNE